MGSLSVASLFRNPYDYDENLVVIYNRVPKTGSTSFVNLAYDLCKKNRFFVLHINVTANMHVLSLNNQVGCWWSTIILFADNACDVFKLQIDFVRNISAWNEMKPALYHGHMAYLDFSKYIESHRKPLSFLNLTLWFVLFLSDFRCHKNQYTSISSESHWIVLSPTIIFSVTVTIFAPT